MIPLELLFEEDGLPSYDIPQGLERLYGKNLKFEAPRLYANFVSSLDGIIALENERNSSQMISGHSEADRFVMGLLRACADAVLVDLTASNYDPIAAIERAASAGRRVLAVGQHDDAAYRKRALAAGAERVYAYRKLFEDGPATLAAWLESGALAPHTARGVEEVVRP